MAFYSPICLYNLRYLTPKNIFVCIKVCNFALLKDTDLCKKSSIFIKRRSIWEEQRDNIL